MTSNRNIIGVFSIVIAAAMLVQPRIASGDEPSAGSVVRSYYIDIEFFSFKPDDALKTYDRYGSGGTGAHGTVGTGATDFGRDFAVSVTGKEKGNGFSAVVEISPQKEDHTTRPQQITLDFSNLEPKSLDLARNHDGRVYRLNLTPRVNEATKPQQFDAKELNLEHWNFQGSPVIVNDQDYVGQLNMAGAPIATLDLPGIANIELSLLRLKGAQPIGALENGTINITRPDGTTVRISNVRNGGMENLPGGPYTVWVKWKPPSESLDEVRKSLREVIAAEKEKAKKGDASLPPARMKRLEEMLAGRSPAMMQSGLKVVEPGDLEESAPGQHYSNGKNQ